MPNSKSTRKTLKINQTSYHSIAFLTSVQKRTPYSAVISCGNNNIFDKVSSFFYAFNFQCPPHNAYTTGHYNYNDIKIA